MVNTLLLKTRQIGSIRFFLNGNVAIVDNRLVRKTFTKQELGLVTAAVKTSSFIESLEDIYQESRMDVAKDTEFPVNLNLVLKESLRKLKEKVVQLTNKHPSIPKPSINSFWDGERIYIDIPLLFNCSSYLKDKNIQDGSIYISIEGKDILEQVKIVLEKSNMVSEDDLNLLIDTYEQSFLQSTLNFKVPQASIGKMFNKNINCTKIMLMDTHKKTISDLETNGCIVYQPDFNDNTLDWDLLSLNLILNKNYFQKYKVIIFYYKHILSLSKIIM